MVAVVDTNCDPSEVDYIIPGNDDALRAIRLFASKIADSVVEGSQAATDKQSAELAAGVTASEAIAAEGETSADVAAAEELNMEVVLGKGVRKVEAAVPESDVRVGIALSSAATRGIREYFVKSDPRCIFRRGSFCENQ